MLPSNASSTYSQLNIPNKILALFLSTIQQGRIYDLRKLKLDLDSGFPEVIDQ